MCLKMSIQTLKLEKGLCRCCHNEGVHKNLAEPCLKEGEVEIYVDMLQSCLDVNLTPLPGPHCDVTFTICEACIERLRDACCFKQQVNECERRFREYFTKNDIKLASGVDIEIKRENTDDDDIDMKVDLSPIHDDDNFQLDFDDAETKVEAGVDIKSGPRKLRPKKSKAPVKSKAKSKPARKPKDETAKNPDSRKKGDEARLYTLTEDGERKYQCNTCQRAYSKQALFSQHYRHVHMKLRPKLRACYYCEVRVPGYLRAQHLEEAHGVQRPTCNACGKKFAYPFQVMHHQKQYHMDEKLHPCAKCELKFSTPSRLARHDAKHSTKRPHKCDYCEKAFKWKKNLKTHIMIHLDDRRHVCVVCHEAFVQQTSLKYHITKRHPEMV